MNTENPRNISLKDLEAGVRYLYVAQVSREILTDAKSPLLEEFSENEPTEKDIELIDTIHQEVAPDNPLHPWRLAKPFGADPQSWAEERIRNGLIADPSYYDNWSKTGGPAEHIKLATDVSLAGQEHLVSNLRNPAVIDSPWAKENIARLSSINPYKVTSSVAFHDDGRLVTHLFSNGPIGRRLLQRIGIREDVINIIPSETSYFKVPLEQEVFPTLQQLPPEMVLVALADNFGKWNAKLGRLPLPEDFTPEKMKAWGDSYATKPVSGRPSDMAARQDLPLHIANEKRVFDAFDMWVKALTTTDLYTYASEMNKMFAPRFQQG